jgi:hypothetical protein
MPNTPPYMLYHGRGTGKDKAVKKIGTRIGAVWPNKSASAYRKHQARLMPTMSSFDCGWTNPIVPMRFTGDWPTRYPS